MGQYIWKCCNRIYYLFLHQRCRRRTSVIYWISQKPSQHLQHQFSLVQKLEPGDNSSWRGQHFNLLSLEVFCSKTGWRAPQTSSSMNTNDFWEWIQISLFLRIPVRQSFQKLVGCAAAKKRINFCWQLPTYYWPMLVFAKSSIQCESAWASIKLFETFQNISFLKLADQIFTNQWERKSQNFRQNTLLTVLTIYCWWVSF